MAQKTGVVINSVPDNDSFLPRYLTVRLINTLAKTLATPNNPTNTYSESGAKLVAECKKLTLFTPLTYSIFWRENADEVLDKYTEPVNALDGYNRSALTIALASENFNLASKLIAKGATVYLEDKVVLEIALTSIIQRDPSVIAKIAGTANEDDKTWIGPYLDYLNAYINNGNPSNKLGNFRDVINPTIRHFGQILDTLVYFNGTPSHYGFISPSITVLNEHLQQYVKQLSNPEELALFTNVAKAFDLCEDTCQFNGNLPLNPKAGEVFSAKIKSNIKINSKDVTMVVGGWAGNSIAIAFINNILIVSNLGTGGDPQQGTKIYSITNPEAITEQTLHNFICGLGNASAPADIIAIIGNMINTTPLFTIDQPLNPIDNCIYVNPRAIIQGILLVISAYKKQETISADMLKSLATKAAETYGFYLDDLYKSSAEDLSIFMRNHELLRNRRIECCSLALEYINQHHSDPTAIARCIELKNALEFVGLKDYYNANVTPEAKLKIQAEIIKEQELTAMQVIEKEAEMLKQQG